MDAATENLLRKLEATVAELRAHLSGDANDYPLRSAAMNAHERYLYHAGGLLNDLESADGEVTEAEFYALGDKWEYDRRGLGGFHAGANASVRRDPGTGNRSLTPAGRRFAEVWREKFGAHPRQDG